MIESKTWLQKYFDLPSIRITPRSTNRTKLRMSLRDTSCTQKILKVKIEGIKTYIGWILFKTKQKLLYMFVLNFRWMRKCKFTWPYMWQRKKIRVHSHYPCPSYLIPQFWCIIFLDWTDTWFLLVPEKKLGVHSHLFFMEFLFCLKFWLMYFDVRC